jgi:hypothetical protein
VTTAEDVDARELLVTSRIEVNESFDTQRFDPALQRGALTQRFDRVLRRRC